MSRTDELRIAGATERGGSTNGTSSGGFTPFVRWPSEEYAWVEGVVVELWEGKYGDNVKLKVTEAEPELTAKGEDGDIPILPDQELNVGLSSASLKDTVTEDDIGKRIHIAFQGWKESPTSGHRYRVFTVLPIPEPEDYGTESALSELAVAPSTEDDELPF